MKKQTNLISRNLTALRQYHKYSQEEVAEKVGVTRQAVAKWESGVSHLETAPFETPMCAASSSCVIPLLWRFSIRMRPRFISFIVFTSCCNYKGRR